MKKQTSSIGWISVLGFGLIMISISISKVGYGNLVEKVSRHFQPPQVVGVSEMQKAHFDQAETFFQKSVKKNPEDAEAAYSLAWSMQAQGKDDEAFEIYRHAHQLAAAQNQPQVLEKIYSNTGAIFMKRRNYPMAEKTFRSALKINPRSTDMYYQIGMVLSARGKKDEANGFFQQVVRLEPSHQAARFQLASNIVEHKPMAQPQRKPASKQKKERKRI